MRKSKWLAIAEVCFFLGLSVLATAGPIGGGTGGTFLVGSFSGADFGEKFTTCRVAIASSGGVCDARLMSGAHTITSSVTWTENNITLLLSPSTTITVTAGVTITVSGTGNRIEGGGWASTIDASAGTSANTVLKISADDFAATNFRMIGNRIAGGTAHLIEVDPTVQRNYLVFQWLRLEEAGADAIRLERANQFWITENSIYRPKSNGVRSRNRSQQGWVERNYIEQTTTGAVGDGAIAFVSTGGTASSDIWIRDNRLVNPAVVGIRIGVGGGVPTRIVITGNSIVGAGNATLNVDGECITFEGVHGIIAHNILRNCYSHGISLYAAVEDTTVDSNEITNVSLRTDANAHGCVEMAIGPSTVLAFTQRNITVVNNRCRDDQGTATTPYLVSVDDFSTGGTATMVNLVVAGNQGDAILNTPRSRCSSAADCGGGQDPELFFYPHHAKQQVCWGGNDPAAAGTNFLQSNCGTGGMSVTEGYAAATGWKNRIANTFATSMTCETSGALGATAVWTMMFRLNAADTALTCAITEPATTCSVVGAVAVAADVSMAVRHVETVTALDGPSVYCVVTLEN